MVELEHKLDALAAQIAFPPTPDLASAVRARLADRRRVRRRWLRVLAIALAVLVVAIGAVMAVPPARTAVLDWFGISGVSIERASSLPPISYRNGEPRLGEEVTLSEAERRADYTIGVPTFAGLGQPDRIYHRRYPPGDMVSFVYAADDGRPRLLLSQWQGSTAVFFEKILPPRARSELVSVGGAPGVWISGGAHAVSYHGIDTAYRREPFYLAGNVLVWELAGVSYRLEADVPFEGALEIAESLN